MKRNTIFFIILIFLGCSKNSPDIFINPIPPIEYTNTPEPFVYVEQPCLELEREYNFDFSHYSINAESDLYELCSSNIDKFDKYETDENGIYLTSLNNNSVYYPITITQAAVHFYKHYKLTNNSKSLAKFLVLADWVKINFSDFGEYGFWFCNEYNPGYDLIGPWPSAMGQGFGLMVMYEAYIITNDSTYLDICSKALNGFEQTVDNNGITNKNHQLMWQFEEYPTTTSSEVLNGFIFALCGLNDYFEATGSQRAYDLFQKGVKYLEQNICRYSLFFTSRYNLYSEHPALANAIGTESGDGYHHLHIQQLSWLYLKTGKHIFLEYATNFLEKDLGGYEANIVADKIDNISASYSIVPSDYGPENLHDGIWTYGYYWSTNKDTTDLYIDFNTRKDDVNRMSLFFTKELIANIDIEIYYKNDDSHWQYSETISSDSSISFMDFYNTRHFNTYIHTYILQPISTEQLKVRIIKNDAIDIIALREIDFQYNRMDDMNMIISMLSESLSQ